MLSDRSRRVAVKDIPLGGLEGDWQMKASREESRRTFEPPDQACFATPPESGAIRPQRQVSPCRMPHGSSTAGTFRSCADQPFSGRNGQVREERRTAHIERVGHETPQPLCANLTGLEFPLEVTA